MDDLERLKARVIVLESLVDQLLGKAISDSGRMLRVLEGMEADNATLPALYEGDPLIAELHHEMRQALAERLKQSHGRSLQFPLQWQRRHAGQPGRRAT